MSLNFGTVAGSWVAFPNAVLEAATKRTLMLWYYPTALVSSRPFVNHGGESGRGTEYELTGTAGNILLRANRATANALAVSNNTPLSTINKWYKIAGTIDEAAGNWCTMWVGDLTTRLTECTYSSRTNGSGTIERPSAGVDFAFGGHIGLSSGCDGRIAWGCACDVILTVGEMENWFQRPRWVRGAQVFTALGYTRAVGETQPNWANGDDVGTIGGTVLRADHVPLGRARRHRVGWAGNVAAPAAATGIPIFYRRWR